VTQLLPILLATGALCGSSPPAAAPAVNVTSAGGPGALQGEANSAAAGDIPDNQVFLVFHHQGGEYSVKYPEGWAQQGSAATVVFRDKNNIVRIVLAKAAAPTVASVRRDLRGLGRARVQTQPHVLRLPVGPALKVVYTTVSAPNPVTGKRVTLVVDRYYLWRSGRRAVVDLGTPEGVDNVDAYRLMIESFRWR